MSVRLVPEVRWKLPIALGRRTSRHGHHRTATGHSRIFSAVDDLITLSLGSAEPPPSSLTGRVIVKACAERYGTHNWLKDSLRLNTEAAQKAAECSATWTDPASDLGMVVDGTFYDFDKTGMVLAKGALS